VKIITSSAYLPEEFQNRKERIYNTVISNIPATVINVNYSNTMSFTARLLSFVGFAVYSTIVTMQQKSDVIFATSTPLTIAVPGVLGKLWNRIPLVFEVRDLWPELPIAIGAIRNPIFIWATRRLERFAYNNSSQIIALSPGMKHGIVSTGYPADKVHVLPNSCDIDFFNVSSNEGKRFREQFDWLGDRSLVVYTGTIGVINGVGYLAHLARDVYQLDPEVRFLVISRSGYEEQLVRELATELDVLNKNFFMVPQIPKNQMPAALAAATIATSLFIDLPEMQNNSANKFFDALASGTAVAINYGGWQADLLEESGAGITLDSLNLPQSAQALINLLDDCERLQQMSVSALALATSRFNRDDIAKQLENILQRAVDSNSTIST